MSNPINKLTTIIKSIRNISSDANKLLVENGSEVQLKELHYILGMITNDEILEKIDWPNISKKLNSNNWFKPETLDGKSINDLRALILIHLRHERFSEGHIQDLIISGYFEKWADELEKNINS